jgi:hypothetical protein
MHGPPRSGHGRDLRRDRPQAIPIMSRVAQHDLQAPCGARDVDASNGSAVEGKPRRVVLGAVLERFQRVRSHRARTRLRSRRQSNVKRPAKTAFCPNGAYRDRTADLRLGNPSDSPTLPDPTDQTRTVEPRSLPRVNGMRQGSTAVRSHRRSLNGQRTGHSSRWPPFAPQMCGRSKYC